MSFDDIALLQALRPEHREKHPMLQMAWLDYRATVDGTMERRVAFQAYRTIAILCAS